jgi:hypothetical protein
MTRPRVVLHTRRRGGSRYDEAPTMHRRCIVEGFEAQRIIMLPARPVVLRTRQLHNYGSAPRGKYRPRSLCLDPAVSRGLKPRGVDSVPYPDPGPHITCIAPAVDGSKLMLADRLCTTGATRSTSGLCSPYSTVRVLDRSKRSPQAK